MARQEIRVETSADAMLPHSRKSQIIPSVLYIMTMQPPETSREPRNKPRNMPGGPVAPPSGAARGFCSRAGDMGMRHWRDAKWPRGDCSRDDKGSLAGCTSPRGDSGNASCSCAAQCEACARCQYYSFARKHDEPAGRGRKRATTHCRWYAGTQCDVRDLRYSAGLHTRGEWQTVQAKRSVPAALPPDLGPAPPESDRSPYASWVQERHHIFYE